MAPQSVTAEAVHVLSHGWAPGLAPVLRAQEEFLRVWDPGAETAEGDRFDGWYAPLAEAITSRNPNAAVLAYSWIDHRGRCTCP